MKPKRGDIILYIVTPASSLASKIIAIGQLLWKSGKGPKSYSHAAIYDGDGYQLEAVWPRTGRYKIDPTRPYEIWRIDRLTALQRQKVIEWAYLHTNEWYNVFALLFGWIQFEHAEVCSTYVDHAYEAAGIHMGQGGKKLMTPNQIPEYKRAKLVCGHLVKNTEKRKNYPECPKGC